MSNRDNSLYIVDIFIAIDKLVRYTKIFNDGDALLHDEIRWDASIRELEIIGEATKTLLNQQLLDENYRRIVDFRNQISHGYFGIDEDIVWDIIQNKLPIYKDDLKSLIQRLEIKLDDAISYAKVENEKNHNVITLLENLEREF